MTDLAKGLEAFENKDYKTALDILPPLAEAGDVNAQYIVGSMCEFGLGTPQHYMEARRYYELAYKQEDVRAIIKLGVIHYHGLLGMGVNHVAAKKILEDVARNGFPEAQYYLALIHEKGEGVEVNNVEAYIWYNIASANGYEDATIARDRVVKSLNPKEIKNAQDTALFLFQKKPKT